MCTLTKHLQNISCLRFTQNDRYLITAGDDSLVIVWDFYELALFPFWWDRNYKLFVSSLFLNRILNSNEKDEFLKPVCTWNNHSMKINDIFVAKTSDRIVTASSDQTCKVFG